MEVNNKENNDVNTDPDVNINSWIFIEKLDKSVNTEFYFKDQVRIEELTEDDLRSTGSISDSDGISVISENEELQSQDECCTCISKTKEQGNEEINKNIIDTRYDYEDSTYINTDSLENLQILPKDLAAKNKIIYITTVTGMCFLATYLFWPKTVDTQEYINDKIIYSELDYLNPDMTNDDILNDVYDKQIWNHFEQFNNSCDINFDLSDNKLNTNFKSDNSLIHQTYNTTKKDISVPIIIYQTNENQKEFRNAQKQKNSNKSVKSPKNKKDKNNIKLKNTKNENKRTKSLKLKENYLNKKDKYLIKKEKYLKRIEKEINLLEAKLQQTYRRMKQESGDYLNKNKLLKKKLNSKKLMQQNITGDWYHNMYFGRSELRDKEKLSDWVFERSKMRSKLREKDSWHFSRAKGREQYRSNEKFHSGKYKIYKSYRY